MSTHSEIQHERAVDSDEYEPEQMSRQLDSQLRVTAAQIAAQIPWNASEPVDDARIIARFNLVYDFIKVGVEKDLA